MEGVREMGVWILLGPFLDLGLVSVSEQPLVNTSWENELRWHAWRLFAKDTIKYSFPFHLVPFLPSGPFLSWQKTQVKYKKWLRNPPKWWRNFYFGTFFLSSKLLFSLQVAQRRQGVAHAVSRPSTFNVLPRVDDSLGDPDGGHWGLGERCFGNKPWMETSKSHSTVTHCLFQR